MQKSLHHLRGPGLHSKAEWQFHWFQSLLISSQQLFKRFSVLVVEEPCFWEGWILTGYVWTDCLLPCWIARWCSFWSHKLLARQDLDFRFHCLARSRLSCCWICSDFRFHAFLKRFLRSFQLFVFIRRLLLFEELAFSFLENLAQELGSWLYLAAHDNYHPAHSSFAFSTDSYSVALYFL